MTQEDKELLLKDLCARLPYKIKIKRNHCPITLFVTGIFGECVHHMPYYVGGNIAISATEIEEVKPYLRPMSSMTEEEKEEFCEKFECAEVNPCDFGYNEGGTLEDYISTIPFTLVALVIDWLNEHHFDYRGLIPMGLALEAKDMYKN